jgi:hypothetical protein
VFARSERWAASADTLRRGEFVLISDRSSMPDAADVLLERQD